MRFKQKFNLKCKKCGDEYEIFETQNNIDKGKYRKNCSIKCSKTRVRSDQIKEKISNTLIKKNNTDRKRICPTCNKEFFYKKFKQKFCSVSCGCINSNINGKSLKAGLASAKVRNRRSKNEIAFGEKCKDYFKNVSFNENFFNGWDADVILHNEKIAILWNGIWHYEKINEKHSVSQVKNRDKIKIKEIENKGYEPYIIKDMGKYSKQKVNLEWDLFLKWFNEKYFFI